ncbi:uncharacterized protein SOCEGT47_054300 [Sorangium cellulosum]|uniref:Secreted protein n=1 Tax=Sorangium cellulosum TaxID=56 RepID=A0A4P2Q663_SORCE|nr:hypothetical protein [Sorangium cellulosum]AUX24890.1 uncharacterized protein SOCEGT47_054300 [Sorangium cellulosum]
MKGSTGTMLASATLTAIVVGAIAACSNTAGDCVLTYMCLPEAASATAGGGGTPDRCIPSEHGEPVDATLMHPLI